MVRECILCKKLDNVGAEVSFHNFPTDMQARNIWLSLIGLQETEGFKKRTVLCSDHFDPADMLIKVNGVRYLKPGAMPKLQDSLFPSSSFSSDSDDIFDSPTKKQDVASAGATVRKSLFTDDRCIEPLINYQTQDEDKEHNEALAEAPNSEAPALDLELTSIAGPSGFLYSSSETLTASEAEHGIKSDTASWRKPESKFRAKRKRRYVGDLDDSDFSTPGKRRKNISLVKEKIKSQRTKIQCLQKSVRRLKNRIVSLGTLMSYLKQKLLITEKSESAITASLSGTSAEIFERLLKGPSKQKFNPSLRCFALTLAFYSPKAYNFVRKTFNRTLPHLETISKWYRTIDGTPGFCKEALNALTLKQESVNPLYCNLVLDEMSIRRQVEWTGQKFTGYVDLGTELNTDSLPEAREALVFMLVCLNGSWKVPVGYFLLDGLASTEKAGLVRKCLEFIHESGVTVTSLTFDGAPVNLRMAENLGANFGDPNNLKTSFIHPITGKEVFIFLDPCHMLKLVRNCFGAQTNKHEIRDQKEHLIKWSFIESLVEKQSTEGLTSATKIKLRHLQWEREKMKVRLATQTLSRSVSDAIDFLREDLQCPEFANSEPTSNFILVFNNIFDIFNSKNRFAKYFYKKPLSKITSKPFFEYMDIVKNYILGLTLNWTPIVKSARKTGFLGFLICIESLKNMFNFYVEQEKKLKYLLTYKLSQDHLELFFGAIRSKGGYNNNPTARQFEAAFKRLLVHSEISAPKTGNTVDLEKIAILTCGSGNLLSRSDDGENLEESEDYKKFLVKVNMDIAESNFFMSPSWDLTLYVQDVVSYIAGFVVKSLKKCITCSKCVNLLEQDTTCSKLQVRKAYGRLKNPSDMVINICKAGEKYFRFFHKTHDIFNKNIRGLLNLLISKSISLLSSNVFDFFGEHLYDGDILDNHAMELIKLILKSYFTIRIHHETTKKIDLLRKNRSRSVNTKLILFRNE